MGLLLPRFPLLVGCHVDRRRDVSAREGVAVAACDDEPLVRPRGGACADQHRSMPGGRKSHTGRGI